MCQTSKHFGGRMHHKREWIPKVKYVSNQPTPPILGVIVCLLILPGKERGDNLVERYRVYAGMIPLNEPCREKTCLRGSRPGKIPSATQIS